MNPTVVQIASNDDTHLGAAAFDALMQEVGQISVESYDRDGVEDYSAMVEAMRSRVAVAMQGNEAFQYGFLLPLVELIDDQRMGIDSGHDWTGAISLKNAVRRFNEASEGGRV